MSKVQRLSETELELMEAIWEYDHPVTSTELLRIFAQRGKEWKAQTISTFLSRLVDKGALSIVTRQGRTNSYAPILSQEEYKLQETQNILHGLYQGSVKNLISSLYDGDRLSDEDIAELKQWFSRK
ncbi:BlaI/MecI/CopY family transcriptional regulator [Paenibacillus thiaminolyticus]|uniref:BlaI/MecI/CopY family transcriptional regulator n=1 Tax=Paenibacillus thiaminolyticus TaxID=49283 RepID=A0AAP9DRC2_PANTH|nr:BlaI/MecI/CopY family transcriptional regulator [Paenibacillus thiaminolyticus]MCY9539043.1 BlaI/MecI/CopY family transcriptional regulator [Paenibacillus thiaminolyticus]MCY9605024.1 BlaI/MecI/CopY family transcriptional regulator [Paenibacillus thiaminolyticus]MCY9611213.1 BlaI/MecI/CopY family transcriptional regulator [Paenibacillus thiaminolyticus]MCY9616845.1 BlaI/MecI/CopY family transcriptional regulator [Paenibacillus thiaminolyticus]MCY9622492.1 BlaI/MecI/CopY family transcription